MYCVSEPMRTLRVRFQDVFCCVSDLYPAALGLWRRAAALCTRLCTPRWQCIFFFTKYEPTPAVHIFVDKNMPYLGRVAAATSACGPVATLLFSLRRALRGRAAPV